jgi:hypothetical protein
VNDKEQADFTMNRLLTEKLIVVIISLKMYMNLETSE